MKSPISWVGGKSKVVKKLLPLIVDHICYVEVFGGAGWLLFAKDASKHEVLNDLDGDLMNFWSVVKNAPDEFINSFNYSLISRRSFDECRRKYVSGEYEDCIERAHIFYYILKTCFGSKLTDTHFGITKTQRLSLNFDIIERDIRLAYERLKHVTIENEDFRKIIKHYDAPGTLFYLDPPYLETMRYQSGEFGINEYNDLAEYLRKIQGKFILTTNDHPDLRKLFSGYNIIDHEVLYTLTKEIRFRREYKELIILNYENKMVGF